ncbi:patatin-like phospholipase family protein [bacterium]|nr:patatin-like phospholipase family protein [bacterium]
MKYLPRLFFLAIFPCLVNIMAQETMIRPKIGLVLSGGGAKGFAHIGILKMLDSLEIPVDYISGTSMGGILGGLYAIGYRGQELENMVLETDWESLFSDRPSRDKLPYIEKRETDRYQIDIGILGRKPAIPAGLVYGRKISLLFSSKTFMYEQFRDFDELPIPFRCVAADLVTGNEVVLEHGSLSKAMRATMAIPTVFSPVEWGDSLLVDGGIVNNCPVDVVKGMGADVIFAVDVLGHEVPREHLDNALNILERATHLIGIDKWRRNTDQADLLILPDLTEFKMSDFSKEKIRQIILSGEKAAEKYKQDLVYFKEVYQLDRVSNPEALPLLEKKPLLENVQIIGPATTPFEKIYGALDLKTGTAFDYHDFDDQISELTRLRIFHKIDYEMIPVSDKAVRLLIRVEEMQQPVIYSITVDGNQHLPFSLIYGLLGLKPGERFDTDILNNRIMILYGLDYFEHIDYEIIPLHDHFIRLHISVKELPMRKLRIGLHYDKDRKLMGIAGFKINSLIVPGIRFENEYQFGAYRRFWNEISYPSRTMKLSVYPYIRQSFTSIPLHVFNGFGDVEAIFQDRSTVWTAGLCWNLSKDINVEIELLTERIEIEPTVAADDNRMFTNRQMTVNQIHGVFNVDTRNDALLPTSGLNTTLDMAMSPERLGNDKSFQRFFAFSDLYIPVFYKNTLRLYGFYGYGSVNMPEIRNFKQGDPDLFAGLNIDQLFARHLLLYRTEFLIPVKNAFSFFVCGNRAHCFESDKDDPLWGAGFGIKFRTPLGLVGIVYALGSQGILNPEKAASRFYYFIGTKF